MENVSLEPMKFGTANEFRIALTELRWIKKDKGKLADNDIATVARKYIVNRSTSVVNVSSNVPVAQVSYR